MPHQQTIVWAPGLGVGQQQSFTVSTNQEKNRLEVRRAFSYRKKRAVKETEAPGLLGFISSFACYWLYFVSLFTNKLTLIRIFAVNGRR